ncbi:hypothetical protein [Asticcacaulis benevestitus]|nr:hypothetical protein [Asticcacaulis benevestitus]
MSLDESILSASEHFIYARILKKVPVVSLTVTEESTVMLRIAWPARDSWTGSLAGLPISAGMMSFQLSI